MADTPLFVSGKPKVRTVQPPNGQTEYHVTPTALTPRRKWLAVKASQITTLSMLVTVIWIFSFHAREALAPEWVLLALPVAAALGWWGGQFLYEELLSKSRTIHFTKDEIKIQRYFFFWKRFDRKHPHTFSLRDHPWLDRNKESQSSIDQTPQGKRLFAKLRGYFENTQILELEYFGEPTTVLVIYDKEKARVIHARLQAIDSILPRDNQTGGSIAVTPKDDWGTDIGALNGDI